jgi:hypothetical protein
MGRDAIQPVCTNAEDVFLPIMQNWSRCGKIYTYRSSGRIIRERPIDVINPSTTGKGYIVIAVDPVAIVQPARGNIVSNSHKKVHIKSIGPEFEAAYSYTYACWRRKVLVTSDGGIRRRRIWDTCIFIVISVALTGLAQKNIAQKQPTIIVRNFFTFIVSPFQKSIIIVQFFLI